MNLTTINDKKSILLSNIYPTLHSPSTLPKDAVRSKVKGMNHIVMAFSFNLPGGQIAQVTEIMMEKYNVTFSELINAINENPCNYVFEKMTSFFSTEDDMPMYVLTNENTHYGAGGICINNVIRRIMNTIQDDFYILPSSVHELIIVPVLSLSVSEYKLSKIVHDINCSIVDQNDRLSNHAYRLNYKSGTITTIPYTE